MQTQLIDTPQALDAAIAANRQARRERLLRASRNQVTRTKVGLALSGSVALAALPAYFWASDAEAATVILVIGAISFSYVLAVGRVSKKKWAEALQEAEKTP